jgi:hypothetical protein
LANNEGGDATFDLSRFLTPGKRYVAEIYSDEKDGKKKSRTGVAVTQKKVKSSDTLKFDIPAKGGVAIRFYPAD